MLLIFNVISQYTLLALCVIGNVCGKIIKTKC